MARRVRPEVADRREVRGGEQDRRQEQQEHEIGLELDRRQVEGRVQDEAEDHAAERGAGSARRRAASGRGRTARRPRRRARGRRAIGSRCAPWAGRLAGAGSERVAGGDVASTRPPRVDARQLERRHRRPARTRTPRPGRPSSRLDRRRDGRLAPEAVALALEREVGVRDAVGGEGRDDGLGLAGRHDLVLEALQDEDRAATPRRGSGSASAGGSDRPWPGTARPAGPGSATRTCGCRAPASRGRRCRTG